MNVSGMTVEGFFLADYERLRQENEELRAKVAHMENSGYGVFDLGHPTTCVKIFVAGSGNYSTDYDGITSETLRAVLEMNDDDLWEWANRKYQDVKTTWRSPLRPVIMERRDFQYTLRVVETRSDATFVTDADPRDESSDMYLVKDWEGEKCLDCWQDESRYDYVREQAIERLRDYISRAIDRVKLQEESE